MMKKIVLLPLIAAFGLSAILPAEAQRRDEQEAARAQMMAGKALSLRSIENRILPTMRGSEYLGHRYYGTENIYVLRFLKKGRVTELQVDAQSGRILSRK